MALNLIESTRYGWDERFDPPLDLGGASDQGVWHAGHVDRILDDVRKVGNRVRVTAQLIDAATDRHLWADSYEREMHDLMDLQREVARTIAVRVRGMPRRANCRCSRSPMPVISAARSASP